MRSILAVYILLCCFATAWSQTTPNVQAQAGSKWAIVVGISSYQNPVLSLQYADRDAKEFARFLQTADGGNLPASHIQLLVNENATYPAIYNALDSLLSVCKKDDIVYFYFSGHGDVENSTIYKLGFLLAYNTPRANYINNAVRIEDLNNFANTLSVKVQAKVILITDACHSGKLAGSDFRASTLIGQQLRTVQNNEIRITSCAPDQLSAEDAGWGGGRGAFSYYLVDGLQGRADADRDKVVTLSEIRQYLDSSLGTDQLLRQKAMKQTPVVSGKNDFRLSYVVNAPPGQSELSSGMRLSMSAPMPALPAQPQTYFFNAWKDELPEKVFDFNALDAIPDAMLPNAFIEQVRNLTLSRLNAGTLDSVPASQQLSNLSALESFIANNPDARQRFCSRLATVFNNRGDDVVNLYLQGDAAELVRRSYYKSLGNDYEVYAKMFSAAARLTPPTAYIRKILDIKTQYFGGVAKRLKIPLVKDPRKLIEESLAYQQRALALEPNAAYIHNELGMLYSLKKQWAAAEKEFKLATLISPDWAIAWSNLAGLYAMEKANWKKSAAASEKALNLQPGLQMAWVNAATLNQNKGALLSAEEQYLKSIEINTRHYYPFEQLASIYLRTTQYARADSFYFEADLRKKGYHFVPGIPAALNHMLFPRPDPEPLCGFDSSLVGPKDILGQFALALRAEFDNNMNWAEKKYKYVLQLDSLNPIAFHYLGKLLFRQRRWQEASLILTYALRNRLDRADFKRYCDSMGALLPNNASKECVLASFIQSGYEPAEDNYLAGRVFDYWNHFAEAEEQYRAIILQHPAEKGGYYLLWRMQEKFGRYRDAEKTITDFSKVSGGRGEDELHAFYERAVQHFPNDPEWLCRAGDFMYAVFASNPDGYPDDVKIIDPDTRREHYINEESQPSNMAKAVRLPNKLPGIDEPIEVADRLYFPLTDGIKYYSRADSLLPADEESLAVVNDKLGDLLTWQGLPQAATLRYEKSVDLQSFNAGARQKLVSIYDQSGRYTKARAQLDSLFNHKEIDFDRQLLLAKYAMHEGDFAFSSQLLNSAFGIHPYRPAQLLELGARLQWLSGNPTKAVDAYRELLAVQPNEPAYLYSIARAFALLGKEEDAWQFLSKSISNGFGYAWVLQADDTWKSYRTKGRWEQLIAQLKPVQYPVHDRL